MKLNNGKTTLGEDINGENHYRLFLPIKPMNSKRGIESFHLLHVVGRDYSSIIAGEICGLSRPLSTILNIFRTS